MVRDSGDLGSMECDNVKDDKLLKLNKSDHSPILGIFNVNDQVRVGKKMEELYEKIYIPSHEWLQGRADEYDAEVRKQFQEINQRYQGQGWAEMKLELYSIALGKAAEKVMGPKIIRSRRSLLSKRMKILFRELRRRKRKLTDARVKGKSREENDKTNENE